MLFIYSRLVLVFTDMYCTYKFNIEYINQMHSNFMSIKNNIFPIILKDKLCRVYKSTLTYI